MGEKLDFGSAWRFSYRIVLPVVLAVGIAVATVAGFVLWSTAKSDERALIRETRLVAHVIDEETKSLISEQEYNASSDEALLAIRRNDLNWIDENLGADLFDNGHYDRIYVLDPKSRPL